MDGREFLGSTEETKGGWLGGFHGNTASRHTGVRIISERVVVEGVILTCRTPLLRR